uniref:Uncharacterized protein n=1 Tax=Romanomermis culicivorax TaxID=13658 RepID=A0A915HJQ0_ROMCU
MQISTILGSLCLLSFLAEFRQTAAVNVEESSSLGKCRQDLNNKLNDPILIEELCYLRNRIDILSENMYQIVYPDKDVVKRKNEFVRFGRSSAPAFVEHPAEKRKNEFVRFGKRKNEFVRFGRNSEDLIEAEKRKNEFVRFGRK